MMAEDPSTPSSELETRPSQSAVARLLLSGTVQQNQGDVSTDRKSEDGGSTSALKVDVSEHQVHDHQSFEVESIEDSSPNAQDGDSSFSQSLKALKCPMCDYSTNDKSNFRRHKRLHQRNHPATLLRCGKCEFSTVLPRKIREHYSHDHGEEYSSPMQPLPPSCPPVVRIQGYRAEHFNGRSLGSNHGHCSSGVIPVSSGSLHPLIASVPPGLHFAGTNPPILTNCLAQFQPYEAPIHPSTQETHMASDYLRSIVSNIITSHQAPRLPASSTITSSSFYLPPPMETMHNISASVSHSVSDRQMHIDDCDGDVVVKSEPVECNGASDVSSSASMSRQTHSDGTRQMDAETAHRLSFTVFDGCPVADRNNETSPCDDVGRFVNATEAATVSNRHHGSSGGQTSTATIKHEISNVGIQCAMPSVKTELMDSSENASQRRARHRCIDRGVQCELISSGRTFNCRTVSDPSGDDQQSFTSVQTTKCPHCGVTFDDEVLFSIHIGCHSHTDPFVCNVCGKPCYNKYGFYSHIMRGHQL
ncbi:DNA-binding protein Ikaros-like [Gigantopelta aegis]|uniref:DNA-binding protein Ikaros-like n=1 Tax=Gigantopelta aegis TaxID=1735272 RepID=UPI001B88C97A|nr:DNA-binding protein Ikaros-like [Gigantopelta aegis]